MACETNIIDITVRNATPDPTDYVLVTTAAGQSYLTPYSYIIATSTADLEYVVAASGGTLNNGDSSFTFPALINKRVRLYRTGIKQSTTAIIGGYSYSFNSATGGFNVVPALMEGEIIQIEAY